MVAFVLMSPVEAERETEEADVRDFKSRFFPRKESPLEVYNFNPGLFLAEQALK